MVKCSIAKTKVSILMEKARLNIQRLKRLKTAGKRKNMDLSRNY